MCKCRHRAWVIDQIMWPASLMTEFIACSLTTKTFSTPLLAKKSAMRKWTPFIQYSSSIKHQKQHQRSPTIVDGILNWKRRPQITRWCLVYLPCSWSTKQVGSSTKRWVSVWHRTRSVSFPCWAALWLCSRVVPSVFCRWCCCYYCSWLTCHFFCNLSNGRSDVWQYASYDARQWLPEVIINVPQPPYYCSACCTCTLQWNWGYRSWLV